jgi:hypothetical protein
LGVDDWQNIRYSRRFFRLHVNRILMPMINEAVYAAMKVSAVFCPLIRHWNSVEPPNGPLDCRFHRFGHLSGDYERVDDGWQIPNIAPARC